VLHINGQCLPIDKNLEENSSKGKIYEYSFVHMGGLRPFSAENFHNDGLTGYGGEKEKTYFVGTGTPKLAQYLVFEVYKDKVVFYIRNAGDKDGYKPTDKLKSYTVYFKNK
jgi:hypothetical protein